MKKKALKKEYHSPNLVWIHITLEESIMAGSVTIDTGGTDQDLYVNDWENADDDRYKEVDL